MPFPNKYRSAIIVSIFVVIIFIVLSLILKSSDETSFFRKVVLEIVVPLENVVNSAFDGVHKGWKRYIFLVGLEEENKRLQKKVSSLTSEIRTYSETHLEFMRLRKLLNLQDRFQSRTIAARVIGRDRSSIFKTIFLDKGTSDGLKAGLPVVAVGGVVGRIIDASWNVSKVLLFIDYNSNIDALVQNVRAQGILQGSGDKGCILKYVQRLENVNVGDAIVTSGMAGVFPKGLLLGTVISVDKVETNLFQKISVEPSVDVSKLEEVLVIVKKEEGQTQ
jgi:rod shape-determining protein MreC